MAATCLSMAVTGQFMAAIGETGTEITQSEMIRNEHASPSTTSVPGMSEWLAESPESAGASAIPPADPMRVGWVFTPPVPWSACMQTHIMPVGFDYHRLIAPRSFGSIGATTNPASMGTLTRRRPPPAQP